MNVSLSPFSISAFRCRFFAYVVLIAFVGTFLPSTTLAQQPTATISKLSGAVLLNGQPASQGNTLRAGDAIETGAGASAVLDLSDGSQLELAENTQLDLTQLLETSGGARVSKVKLAWGWVRAKLSPGHQQTGSKFDIETPNALIGVKFSDPTVVVKAFTNDRGEPTTMAFAVTVGLAVTNLLTGEKGVVPVGSRVIIVGTTLQILSGLAEAGALGSMSTSTKAVIGAGLALAAGGTVLALSGSGDGGETKDFTGRFEGSETGDNYSWTKVIELTQTDKSLSGTLTVYEIQGDCTCDGQTGLYGEVTGDNRAEAYANDHYFLCKCLYGYHELQLPYPFVLVLQNGGDTLFIESEWGNFLQRVK